VGLGQVTSVIIGWTEKRRARGTHMGTLHSRTTIRCASSNLHHHRSRSRSNCSTSSSNCSTCRNNDHDHYVGNNRRNGHYRQTYLPTSAPFHRRLCPRPSAKLLYSTFLLQRQQLNHYGSVRTVHSEEEEEELVERGDRALARESAGRRNRCLYRLRLRFHAKLLIRSGIMMRVWRI
jgi:hypothetical protein